MAPTALDTRLILETLMAREARRAVKADRARAMDWIIDLLLERHGVKVLVEMALPYLWTAPARSEALADQALTPKDIAAGLEELLGIDNHGRFA